MLNIIQSCKSSAVLRMGAGELFPFVGVRKARPNLRSCFKNQGLHLT